MLFLETVKKICGSNENLYEAILSLYKNDPEHFVFTFCNELDAKVNNAYAAGVLDQIFANDGIQFNVLGASVRLSVGKQEHTVIYNAGFGGVRNDSVNITIMDEVAHICGEEGNSFSLNRGPRLTRRSLPKNLTTRLTCRMSVRHTPATMARAIFRRGR